MKFEQQDLINGLNNEKMSKETPNTFGELNGSSSVNPAGEMKSPSGRKAGEEGIRAMEMLNNPVEAERTQKWLSAFGLTNEGMQFNQAKMGIPPE